MTSPSSDRLDIDMEGTSQSYDSFGQHTLYNHPNVTPPGSSFSMTRLLHGNSLHHVTEQSKTTCRQVLPSIEEFALHHRTTLADTMGRINELVQPRDLHVVPKHAQMLQPVTSNTTTSTSGQGHAHTDGYDRSVQQTATPSTHINTTDTSIETTKPPYTYVGLIIMAIDSSKEKMLTRKEVRAKFKTWFPFFNGSSKVWPATVGHTLGRHKCFYKRKLDTETHCHYWAVNYDNVKQHMLVRQTRDIPGQIQQNYAYYLHEQLDVPPILIPGADWTVDKRGDLELPPKPSCSCNGANPINKDLSCDRTADNHVSQDKGELDSLTQTSTHSPNKRSSKQQKRKAHLPESSEHHFNETAKRKKTAAVNPTPLPTISHSQMSKQESTHKLSDSQTFINPTFQHAINLLQNPTYRTDYYSCGQHDVSSNSYNPSSLQHPTYHTDIYFSGQHDVSYNADPSSDPYAYQYQSHHWPLIDSSAYNPIYTTNYNTNPSYQQTYDISQQYNSPMVPTCHVWPYYTS